jgi:hypothetical protein
VPPVLQQSLQELYKATPRSNFKQAERLATGRQSMLLAERSAPRERLVKALDPYQHRCMICMLLDKADTPKHEIIKCPTLRNQQLVDKYMDFSRSIKYATGAKPNPCFRCHVIMYNDTLHQFNQEKKGRKECVYYDIMLPICFMIGMSANKKGEAEQAMKVQWAGMEEMGRWLSDRDQVQEGFVTNVEALYVWWYEQQ